MLLQTRARQRYGYTVKQCLQMIAMAAVGGFWGARFFYCATHWRTFVENCKVRKRHPAIQMLIPIHGLTQQGGLLGTLLLWYLYCRWNQLSFAQATDFGAAPFALGVCFGRVGCLFNGCCFGKVMESAVAAAASGATESSTTSGVWSQCFYHFMSTEYLLSAYPSMRWIQRDRTLTRMLQHDEHDEAIHARTLIHNDNNNGFTDPLYATQLYAAVGNLMLCIILYQIGKQRRLLPVDGQLSALYLILYSLQRLLVEAYRDRPMPSDQMFTSPAWRNIYESHILCFLFILVGSVILWRTRHAIFAKKSSYKDEEKKTT